jgi:transposase InsO family protein
MVERVRQDLESDRRAHLRRIEWLTPGVVWAMDGTEYDVGLASKIYLCNTQDLGSRYKFFTDGWRVPGRRRDCGISEREA